MIVCELTGSLTYVVPVSLSILVAKTVRVNHRAELVCLMRLTDLVFVSQVADALEGRGIYDLVIQLAGLPFLDAKESQSVAIVSDWVTGSVRQTR